MERKYTAFTLMEMLIVLSIVMILGGIGISSFLGLNNTVKMNEYTMNLEQDIRRMQRASMLLERNPMENWLYGIGIDFRDMYPDGEYVPFKWCTPYSDYGHISTTSIVPAYEPELGLGGAKFPAGSEISGSLCESGIDNKNELRILSGFQPTLTIPKANIQFGRVLQEGEDEYPAPVIVLFESVSGRAFFYDEEGNLLNYERPDDRLVMVGPDEVEDLIIRIKPIGRGVTRQITITHLTGKVHNIPINK